MAGYKQLADCEEDDVGAWLRRLAGNYALAWYKKNPGVSLVDSFVSERVPDDHQTEADKLRRLENAMQQLTGPERMALELSIAVD